MDTNALVDQLHAAIKEYVQRTVAPLEARLKEAESALTIKPANGKDGQDGKDGKDGIDGKSAYDLAVDAGFVGTIEQWVSSLKGLPGQDGKDGKDGQDGQHGQSAYTIAVEKGFVGSKEEWLLSLKGQQGEKGERGDIGPAGQDGLHGKDGKDGIQGIPGERGEKGLDGQDGRDGRDGEPGRDALQIDVLDGIDLQRRYQRGTYAHWRGGIIRSTRQTDPVADDDIFKAGWHVVVNGIADVTIEQNDLRSWSMKMLKTDGVCVEKTFKAPTLLYKGIWRPENTYEAGDTVTREGSTWICLQDNPGKPGDEDSGWQLSVKKGRDGKDGIRGEKGERGAEGRAGKDLTQIGSNGAKW